jgi:hypothetical protein
MCATADQAREVEGRRHKGELEGKADLNSDF